MSQNGYGDIWIEPGKLRIVPGMSLMHVLVIGPAGGHSPGEGRRSCICINLGVELVSTVLAQDRFFSVSLSFTLDKQDPQSHHDDVIGRGP